MVLFDLADGVDPQTVIDRYPEGMPEQSGFAATEWLTSLAPAEVVETDRATGLIWSVIALSALIVLASLGHALAGSVRQHRRDYATLKTIGFTRRQIVGAVTWQSIAPVVARPHRRPPARHRPGPAVVAAPRAPDRRDRHARRAGGVTPRRGDRRRGRRRPARYLAGLRAARTPSAAGLKRVAAPLPERGGAVRPRRRAGRTCRARHRRAASTPSTGTGAGSASGTGGRRARGRRSSCSPPCEPPAMSPPTMFGLWASYQAGGGRAGRGRRRGSPGRSARSGASMASVMSTVEPLGTWQ